MIQHPTQPFVFHGLSADERGSVGIPNNNVSALQRLENGLEEFTSLLELLQKQTLFWQGKLFFLVFQRNKHE